MNDEIKRLRPSPSIIHPSSFILPQVKEGLNLMEVDEGAMPTMPAATNKQRLLTLLFNALKKRYQPSEPAGRPVLEQLLYSVCREGTTRERADRVFLRLRDRFYDWNEIRVSSPREIANAIADLSSAEVRAQRLLSLLQEVFETTFS